MKKIVHASQVMRGVIVRTFMVRDGKMMKKCLTYVQEAKFSAAVVLSPTKQAEFCILERI